jgi:hypothetical protein
MTKRNQNSVGGLDVQRTLVRFPERTRERLLYKKRMSNLVLIQPHIQGIPEVICPEVKRPGGWSWPLTSIYGQGDEPPLSVHTFMALRLVKHSDNFTVTILYWQIVVIHCSGVMHNLKRTILYIIHRYTTRTHETDGLNVLQTLHDKTCPYHRLP